jgi:enoyl-CoA hydratase/carnithine racemase
MPIVTFQQIDHLGEIVLDSPPQNLFSGDLLSDLRDAVNDAASSDVRAVLVRAEGDDFSAGADVSIFVGIDAAQAAELAATVVGLIHSIEALPVPTVALIQGQCYAGALEVCLACDLIWAAEGSQIGQIEAVAGGIPYAGGTQRLASRIGVGRAAEMVFTAAVLQPETLASWGVINRVIPAGRLVEDGLAFGQTLAKGPTRAYATTKRLLHTWRSDGLAAADRVNLADGPAVMVSHDLQAGIASLVRNGPGHAVFNGN